MEQHPVPQNVTTFQFRLIGDMTIKQFGFLAAGAIGGYIFYKLPLPFFFDWPLAVSSVLLGIGLAFVPIEERPMDVWLLSFIKSIYSPTQYVWSRQKEQSRPAESKTPPITAPVPPTVSKPTAATTPSSLSLTQTLERLFQPAQKPIGPTKAPSTAVILSQQTPWDPFAFLKNLFAAQPKAAAPARVVPHISPAPPPQGTSYPDIFAHIGPMPSLTGTKIELPKAPLIPSPQSVESEAAAKEAQQKVVKKEQELTEKLEKMQAELTTKTTTDARILELQKQLTDMLSQRSQMEQELTSLRSKLHEAGQAPQVMRQAGVMTNPQVAQPTVRVITAETAVKAGLPRLTTFPNVVTGIIKDAEGNLLPGVLVTVRDKDEMPVRALKTNKLGQFAASTPLPNGTFTVDIEDPRGQHFFDRVRVTFNGSVMAPVEVISKSKKQMERSQLEKSIFGANQI